MTREQLYDLVWSKAMRLIAKDLGKSDVAVAKSCRHASVPVPPRGYWNRLQAGKRVTRTKLPPRFPGASDEVRLRHPEYPDTISDEPPKFLEPIEEVARRAAAIVGKVRPLRNGEAQHPIVVDLLRLEREDYLVQRGLTPAPSDNPSGRRCMRILGSLLMALARSGCTSSMSRARYASERPITVSVGCMSIVLTVEAKAKSKGTSDKKNIGEDVVVIAKLSYGGAPRSWTDDDSGRIEQRLTEIAAAILVSGEELYRASRLEDHRHALRHRAWLEEERLRRVAEAEKARIAADEKKAKERVDVLLEQASNLHRATTIRSYVEAVVGHPEMDRSAADLARWAVWARVEADRLDPILNGAAMRSLACGSQLDT